jgi:glutamine synthetase
MPKPATGMIGNGCHHNVSLWTTGEEAANVLAEPGRTDLHLTEADRHPLGEILAHAAGGLDNKRRPWPPGLDYPFTLE